MSNLITNNIIRVTNIEGKNGNTVKNQFIIRTPEGKYFQSYNSIIVFIPYKHLSKIELDERYWNYSKTTSKYRNIFLNETIKETKEKLKNGTYVLKNLNLEVHL